MDNNYETVVILDGNLNEDEINTKLSKMEKAINENGKITDIEKWGKKRLAYKIKRKDYGFYVIYRYTAKRSFIEKFENDMKLDEAVLRYLVLTMKKKHMKKEDEN